MRTSYKWKRVLKLGVIMCLAWIFALSLQMEAKAAPKVTGFRQTDGYSRSVSIEWDDYQTEGYVKYRIYKRDGQKVDLVSTTTSQSDYISGLAQGHSYDFRVEAWLCNDYYSPVRKIAETDWLECTTAPTVKPKDFKEISSTSNSITIGWTKATGANLYKVKISEKGGDFTKTVSTSNNKVTLTKLKTNREYSITICGERKSAAGFIADSADSYLYAYASVVPTKVTGVKIDDYWRYSEGVNVKFNSLGNKYYGADGYQAETWTAYKKKDTKVASGSSSTGYGISMFSKQFGKTNFYKVRVRAYTVNSTNNKKKYGPWSGWVYTAPQPKVKKMKSYSKGMQISYEKITGASRYDVYVSTSKKSGYKKVASTTKTTYTLTKFKGKKLKKGTTYYVYVLPAKKVGKTYHVAKSKYGLSCYYAKYR